MINQLEKVYFTTKEALKDIKSVLENGYDGYLCDLHHEVFNTDYYITGNYRAEKALEQYGTFSAIRTVKEYEEGNFGEVVTELYEPENLANMLYYIVGENAINSLIDEELDEYWNDQLDAEIVELIISKIDSLLVEM